MNSLVTKKTIFSFLFGYNRILQVDHKIGRIKKCDNTTKLTRFLTEIPKLDNHLKIAQRKIL